MISSVAVNIYNGNAAQPKCNEAERINLWLEHIMGKQSLNRLWAAKSIKQCEEIELEQLMDKKISLKHNMHYWFKTTICEIENKSKPWYEACASCLKAIIKTAKRISSANCTKQPVQIMQRYRLTMTVQDNDTSTRLTLFEDVASNFIGCSVNEYIELLNKELDEKKFLNALDNSIKE
ncbi:uncharacterized protein [Primulina eburnea]|uniref:uncharacterized protein n=1 Tax=Primulina eburnea TaxID=1245227 RepID=UPI003C6C4D7A